MTARRVGTVRLVRHSPTAGGEPAAESAAPAARAGFNIAFVPRQALHRSFSEGEPNDRSLGGQPGGRKEAGFRGEFSSEHVVSLSLPAPPDRRPLPGGS